MKLLKKKDLEEFWIKDDIGKDIIIQGEEMVREEMRKYHLVNIINVKDQKVKKKIIVVNIMVIIRAQNIIKVIGVVFLKNWYFMKMPIERFNEKTKKK